MTSTNQFGGNSPLRGYNSQYGGISDLQPTQGYPAHLQPNSAYACSSTQPDAPPPYPMPTEGLETKRQAAKENYGYAGDAPYVINMQASSCPRYASDTEETIHENEDGQFSQFSDKSIRLGFVRKVFGILSLQLLFTFGVMALFVYCEPIKDFTYRYPWLYLVPIVSTIVIIIALGCCGKLRRKTPYNFIFLFLFTLAMSWMLGSIVARFSAKEVWMAIGITCAITLAMCILGMQTKIDLTWTTGLLMILLLCLLGFGILCAIVRTRYGFLALAAVGAGLFSVWLLVDIQLIMGGHSVEVDPEEYVFAALNIYLDIINILIRILAIIAVTSR